MLLLGVSPALAQDVRPETSSKTGKRVDEITVVGDETVPRLRGKLRRLDEEFFDRYNELNENDQYDMICKKEARIGSQILYTVCRSKLHRVRQSETGNDVLLRDGIDIPVSDAWARRHYRKVRENVSNVTAKDETLSSMLAERVKLRERIETLKSGKKND